jgi:hypothetical protein
MIVRSNPPGDADLDRAEQAWFESDAESNDQAIREIDAEAARHGLVRVNEYWLQKHPLPDGKVVRRGFCYRPEDTNLVQRLEGRRSSEPLGTSSGELVRETRSEQR